MAKQPRAVAEERPFPGDKTPVPASQGGLPAIPDYGDDAGAGMENVDRDETRIPFVRVLQTNSPQVSPADPARIPGAEAGMLMHMGTNECWPGDGRLEFIACFRGKDYVEWVPKNKGGGLVGRHDWNSQTIAKLREVQGRFGKLVTPDGTEIAQTFYLYGLLLVPDSGPRRTVLGFTSTQIKKYQSVIDRVDSLKFIKDGKNVQPPLYAWKWRLSTVPEKNNEGSWFGIRVEPVGKTSLESLIPRNDPMFALARDFHELVKTGSVTAAAEQMAGGAAESTEIDDSPPLE